MASSDSAALAAHNDKWCRSTEKGTAQFREDGGTEVERTGAPRRRRRRAPAACRWWCGPWQAAPWCARGDAAAEKRKRKVETGTWGEVRVVKIDTLQTLIVSCSRERKKSSRSSEEASPRFYLLLKRDLIITVFLLLLLSLLNRDLIIITGDKQNKGFWSAGMAGETRGGRTTLSNVSSGEKTTKKTCLTCRWIRKIFECEGKRKLGGRVLLVQPMLSLFAISPRLEWPLMVAAHYWGSRF